MLGEVRMKRSVLGPVLGGLLAGAYPLYTPAQTLSGVSHADLYGAYADVTLEPADESTQGFGGGARLVRSWDSGLAFAAGLQYLPTDTDEAGAPLDVNLLEYRIGFSYTVPLTARNSLGAQLQWVSLERDAEVGGGRRVDTEDGYAIHLTDAHRFGTYTLYGSAGHVGTGNLESWEVTVGGEWIPDYIGYFAEYQFADTPDEQLLNLLRVGLRVRFGGEYGNPLATPY